MVGMRRWPSSWLFMQEPLIVEVGTMVGGTNWIKLGGVEVG